jgi:hypothetical protein
MFTLCSILDAMALGVESVARYGTWYGEHRNPDGAACAGWPPRLDRAAARAARGCRTGRAGRGHAGGSGRRSRAARQARRDAHPGGASAGDRDACGAKSVEARELRRNLVVSGINLAALRGRRVRVGGAVLGITGPCAPCSRMEAALGPGGYTAMRGHGGWCAEVVRPGVIALGDEVSADVPEA